MLNIEIEWSDEERTPGEHRACLAALAEGCRAHDLDAFCARRPSFDHAGDLIVVDENGRLVACRPTSSPILGYLVEMSDLDQELLS